MSCRKFILLLVLPFVFLSGQARADLYPVGPNYIIKIRPAVSVDGSTAADTSVMWRSAADAIAAESSPGLVYASGSYFKMAFIPGAYSPFVPNANGGYIDLGDYQPFRPNPDAPRPDPDGNPGTTIDAGAGYALTLTSTSNIIEPFQFGGNATYVGTNPVSYQSGNPHPAPALYIDTANCPTSSADGGGWYCNVSMDLSSWEVFWQGAIFEQGPRPDNTGPFILAQGKLYLNGGPIVLDWKSQIKGGIFGGITAIWHLEGDLVPVPVPPAVWLFASGLAGLFGLARKSKQSKLTS